MGTVSCGTCYRILESNDINGTLAWNGMEKITAKYEKRGKYFPILHEATSDNYFIVNYLLKLHVARVILLTHKLHQACVI